jgi:hypothetical protein
MSTYYNSKKSNAWKEGQQHLSKWALKKDTVEEVKEPANMSQKRYKTEDS